MRACVTTGLREPPAAGRALPAGAEPPPRPAGKSPRRPMGVKTTRSTLRQGRPSAQIDTRARGTPAAVEAQGPDPMWPAATLYMSEVFCLNMISF